MRIAQVMAGAVNGGAELFYERMTLALARAGQEVLPIIRREPARASRLMQAGLKPLQLRFGSPLDLATRPKIRTALRLHKTDVAIAWMARAAAHLPTGPWQTIGRLGGYYNLKYFRSSKYLAGNTRGIVSYIISTGFPAARTQYLPNFVDDFCCTEAADRAGIGVPRDARLLLGLGRLHQVKGFDILIRATALLPGDVYCIIAGEGPERPALERLIADLRVGDRVKLLGWRHDSGGLLKAADVFVSSSSHEPLGNMILESFSAQTPVLATRAEGPLEIIRHGEDGLLVPIGDPAALAYTAQILLNDANLCTILTRNARQRFATEFSEVPVVAAWMDFLNKVTS